MNGGDKGAEKVLVDEDRARARGQSLDRNFGTFFAGFMVSLFSVFVVVLSVWPPQFSNDTSRDFSAGSVRLASHDSLVENFERMVFGGGAQYTRLPGAFRRPWL